MPNRIFIARNDPPSVSDHIRSHSEAFITSGFGLVVGVLILLGGLSPSFDPSPSLAELPDWLNFTIGAVLTAGSGMRLWTITRTFDTQDDYWEAHRYACIGQMLGWLCYALAAFWLRTYSIIPWLMGFCMTTMPAWAFVESFLDERRIRGDRACPESRQEGPPSESH